MPAPLAVDREQVRMLVMEVGVRDAARKLNLSENTVLAWSKRGGWLDYLKPENQPKPPASMQSTVAIGAIKPVDCMAATLAEGAKRTKLGLTKYAARMAEAAGDTGTLEEAPLLKAVADIHGKMHPEAQDGDRVTLAFFSIQSGTSEGPVVDV